MNMDNLTARLDRAAIDGTLPGYACVVVNERHVMVHATGGFRQLEPIQSPASPEIIYDVASLTKPVVTASLFLLERSRRTIDLAWTLGDVYGSDCPADKRPISLADLLSHRSGLPDWLPLSCHARTLDQCLRFILNTPLLREKKNVAHYSCLGYILLSDCYRRLRNVPFDHAARECLFTPLSMTDSYFCPPSHLLFRIAPTERGNAYEKGMITPPAGLPCTHREGLIHGQVHDGNAWTMGGISGNAGLFSTAADLGRFTMCLLQCHSGRSHFFTRQDIDDMRTSSSANDTERMSLGWQLPAASWSGGPALSADSIGHTGFTGCSLHVDFSRMFAVVLLTNRVHPLVGDGEPIRKLRREVASLASRLSQ